MTPNDYLDAAEKALGGISDYALAKHFMVCKQDISQVRHGKKPLNAYLATQVAIALGIDPAQVIADVESQQDKNPERAAFWRSFLLRARKAAAVFLGTLALLYGATCADGLTAGSRAARRRFDFA